MTIISSRDINIYTKKCIYTRRYVCSTAIALKHQPEGKFSCSITLRQCEANRNTVDPLLATTHYRGHPSNMATHLIHYYTITDYTLISLLPKPTSLMLPSLLGNRIPLCKNWLLPGYKPHAWWDQKRARPSSPPHGLSAQCLPRNDRRLLWRGHPSWSISVTRGQGTPVAPGIKAKHNSD